MTLTLMTPCDVTIVEPGKLMLKGAEGQFGHATIIYDAKKLKAITEKVVLDDERLSRGWETDHLTRIVLKATSPPKKDTWTVMP